MAYFSNELSVGGVEYWVGSSPYGVHPLPPDPALVPEQLGPRNFGNTAA